MADYTIDDVRALKEELRTNQAVGDRLGVSRETVRLWLKAGRITTPPPKGEKGLLCPKCDVGILGNVRNTRTREGYVYRSRECGNCGEWSQTIEIVI